MPTNNTPARVTCGHCDHSFWPDGNIDSCPVCGRTVEVKATPAPLPLPPDLAGAVERLERDFKQILIVSSMDTSMYVNPADLRTLLAAVRELQANALTEEQVAVLRRAQDIIIKNHDWEYREISNAFPGVMEV